MTISSLSPCPASVKPLFDTYHYFKSHPLVHMGTRNVVLLGEVGSGKSSIVNLIAGKEEIEISNDVDGGTLNAACYTLNFGSSDVRVNLWDTPGWNPAREENKKQGKSTKEIEHLLKTLHAAEGIHLLLFCMRAGRATNNLLENYNNFYSKRAWRKTPVGLVITHLERFEPNMHKWWEDNGRTLERQKLKFYAHACVTTVDDEWSGKKKISQNILRRLVVPTESPDHGDFCPGLENVVRESVIVVRTASLHQYTQSTVIIVTGPVGSGKSSFISRLAGIPEDRIGVGHSLEPCTSCVREFRYVDQQSGKRVTLLDVPGFLHPSLNDKKVLKMIASWLKNAYKGNAALAGILYLHSVAHPLVTAVSPMKFSPLRKKCGGSIISKLTLVTTMWDTVSQTDGEVRLAECERVWRPVLRPGEPVPRYLNTHQSAREIIQRLLSS